MTVSTRVWPRWWVGGALMLCLAGAVQGQDRFSVSTPGAEDGDFFTEDNASNANDCGGQNVSPAVSWNHAPAGTTSFALVLQDPDGQKGLGVDHWIHYGMPASVSSIAENLGGEGNLPGVGGKNTRGSLTYAGPCPPQTDSAHHYLIQLYALDLAPDALPAGLTRTELYERIKGHVLANTGVVRRYQR